eukprot:scaffold99857_cov27-Tisochrysis_lutea.AAC.3
MPPATGLTSLSVAPHAQPLVLTRRRPVERRRNARHPGTGCAPYQRRPGLNCSALVHRNTKCARTHRGTSRRPRH